VGGLWIRARLGEEVGVENENENLTEPPETSTFTEGRGSSCGLQEKC